MSEPFLLALFAGCLLGAIFFGGLWWTIQKGAVSSQPAVWFFVSFLLRTSIVLTGFYFILAGDWRRLAACLLGFLIARVVVTRSVRLPPPIEEGTP
jgi:F1F0 ATPase subunit 2